MEICKNLEICSQGDRRVALWRMWALQMEPGVLGGVKTIPYPQAVEKQGPQLFISFHWTDVEMDARFVIYAKNRSRGVFGGSLRSEKCIF